MPRRLIAIAVLLAGGTARADDPPPSDPPAPPPAPVDPVPAPVDPAPAPVEPAPVPAEPPGKPLAPPTAADEIGDQGLGGAIGLATGGRVTPGGLRITGHYLYQLSEQDWFDGIASFTFGGGDAACFRDREDAVVCDHGLADGGAIEIAAGVRRMFPARGQFRPFVRVAVGLSYVRFGDDDVSGIVIPLHAGGGLRVQVAPSVAITALAELTLGIGRFNHDLGAEPQLGLAITAGAELRLR